MCGQYCQVESRKGTCLIYWGQYNVGHLVPREHFACSQTSDSITTTGMMRMTCRLTVTSDGLAAHAVAATVMMALQSSYCTLVVGVWYLAAGSLVLHTRCGSSNYNKHTHIKKVNYLADARQTMVKRYTLVM